MSCYATTEPYGLLRNCCLCWVWVWGFGFGGLGVWVWGFGGLGLGVWGFGGLGVWGFGGLGWMINTSRRAAQVRPALKERLCPKHVVTCSHR